jgi:hypothetical protein
VAEIVYIRAIDRRGRPATHSHWRPRRSLS